MVVTGFFVMCNMSLNTELKRVQTFLNMETELSPASRTGGDKHQCINKKMLQRRYRDKDAQSEFTNPCRNTVSQKKYANHYLSLLALFQLSTLV